MTEKEMIECSRVLWNDPQKLIYSYWDERTEDKRLLCASADVATVYKFILDCGVATEEEKQTAEQHLADLEADKELDGIRNLIPAAKLTKPTAQSDTFLIAELEWTSLSMQRRKEPLSGCGYSTELWNEAWHFFPPQMQVLLTRELERVSGRFATLPHSHIMEDLRSQAGWEKEFDPRLNGKAKPARTL